MEFYLRELRASDIETINNWRADRAIVDNLGAPFRYINLEKDNEWYESYLKNSLNNIRLAVCTKDNDQMIGVVYLLSIDWIIRSTVLAIQIGISDFQGKGAGTFAIKSALEHAFNDLGLNRVELTVLEDNSRAIKLYKKLGFKTEGTLRHAAYKNGEFLNMNIMSILAGEFD